MKEMVLKRTERDEEGVPINLLSGRDGDGVIVEVGEWGHRTTLYLTSDATRTFGLALIEVAVEADAERKATNAANAAKASPETEPEDVPAEGPF